MPGVSVFVHACTLTPVVVRERPVAIVSILVPGVQMPEDSEFGYSPTSTVPAVDEAVTSILSSLRVIVRSIIQGKYSILPDVPLEDAFCPPALATAWFVAPLARDFRYWLGFDRSVSWMLLARFSLL